MQRSMLLMSSLFLSRPPMTISSSVSGIMAKVQERRGMGSLATFNHCSVCGMYILMVEEGRSPPIATSEPWNDAMAGLLAGVSRSGCHSVGWGPLLVSLAEHWDMALDMSIGMDTLTAEKSHNT